MKKLYVVGNQYYYSSWVDNVEVSGDFDPDPAFTLEEADIVMFTGGEDVNPALYGHDVCLGTYYTESRDAEEVDAFNRMHEGQLALGICRGLQLLNVLNGGILVQDVTRHAIYGTHEMHNDTERYEITSLHHQMVYPWTIDNNLFDILYWAKCRSKHYTGFDIDSSNFEKYGEPEVVLYHLPGRPKCLGIQGHPEMMRDYDCPTVNMLNELVASLIENDN